MTKNELQRYKEALSEKMAELYATLGNRRPIAIEFTPEPCERIVLAAQQLIEPRAHNAQHDATMGLEQLSNCVLGTGLNIL